VLQSENLERALSTERAAYRRLQTEADNAATRTNREGSKGALWLDGLRRKMGDEAFFRLMSDYFNANTTRTVTAQSFLDKAGVHFEFTEPGDGPAYVASDMMRRLHNAVLVYGTVRETGANRYAAEQMQTRFLDWFESAVPIYKDFEVSDEMLRHRDVIFVGRPEANSALEGWVDKLAVKYRGASFEIDGHIHASEREGLALAAKNPLDPAHMVVVVAGNDALRTVKAARSDPGAEYTLFDDGPAQRSGFIGEGAGAAEMRGRRR
jgi:hypothetical protein